MAIKDDLKNSVKLASDAATDALQALVEKSRLRANANRIKQVIKSDSDLRNQAYIELGRYFYENFRDLAGEDEEALCVIVDKTSNRINKATQKYVDTICLIEDTKLSGESAQLIKEAVTQKATMVKEKAKTTTDKAKAKVADLSGKAKVKAQDFAMKTKETAANVTYKAKDKVQNINPFTDDEDIEEFIFGDEIEAEEIETDVVFDDFNDIDEPDKFVIIDDDDEFLDDEIEEDIIAETEDIKETTEEKKVVELDYDEESPEEFEF